MIVQEDNEEDELYEFDVSDYQNPLDRLTPSRLKAFGAIRTHFTAFINEVKTDGQANSTGVIIPDDIATFQQVMKQEEQEFSRRGTAYKPLYLTERFVGCFFNFLEKKNLRGSTMVGYISSFRGLLKYELGVLYPLANKSSEEYWKNMKKSTKALAEANGLGSKDRTVAMRIDDLKLLTEMLWEENTAESLQKRALLSLQWQILGRINETGVTMDNFEFYRNGDDISCLSVKVRRSKVSATSFILSVLHPTSFVHCFHHALGSWILMDRVYESLFMEHVSADTNASKFMGTILKEGVNKARDRGLNILEGMTSHSVRHGAATYLNLMDGVNGADINRRGGWLAGESLGTNHYVSYGLYQNPDLRLARHLSEWKKPHLTVGKSPQYKWLPEELVMEVKGYIQNMLGTTLNNMEGMLELLGLNLIMHYNKVKESYGNHLVCKLMERAAIEITKESATGIEKLKKWSEILTQRFKTENLLSSELPASPSSSIIQSFDKIDEKQSILGERCNYLAQEVVDIKDRMNAIDNSVKTDNAKLLSKMEEMGTTLKQLLNSFQQFTQSGTVVVNAGVDPPQQNIVPWYQLNPNNNNGGSVKRNKRKLDSECYSERVVVPEMDKLTAGKLFSQWYNTQLYKAVNNYQELKELPDKERNALETYIMVVYYSKCLLPDGTRITAKPAPDCDEALKVWQQKILEWSGAISVQWEKLLQANRKDEMKRNPAKKMKNTTLNAYVSCVKKLIPVLKQKKLFDFTKNGVVDEATPDFMRYETMTHKVYNRRVFENIEVMETN